MTTAWTELSQHGSNGGIGAQGTPGIDFNPGGRLTLTAGTPLPTADQIGQTTLYYSRYVSSIIPLYDGTRWNLTRFDDLSYSVAATGTDIYDVFVYKMDNGQLTLELVAWTHNSTSARATELATQNGIYVKSGSPSHLYLGTVYVVVANQLSDTLDKRYIWNHYNRVLRAVRRTEITAAASWPYVTGSWRVANNSGNNQVNLLSGIPTLIHMEVHGAAGGGTATKGIGICTNGLGTSNDADVWSTNNQAGIAQLAASLDKVGVVGLNRFIWSEWGGASAVFYGTTTIGTAGAGANGLTGLHWC